MSALVITLLRRPIAVTPTAAGKIFEHAPSGALHVVGSRWRVLVHALAVSDPGVLFSLIPPFASITQRHRIGATHEVRGTTGWHYAGTGCVACRWGHCIKGGAY